MDYGMLQGAVVGLKTAADLAIAFGKVKTMAEVQGKAVELQQVILSAQSSALAAQSEQFTLLQEIRDLKEEVARVKAWDTEKQRYALAKPWAGAVVYALKESAANGEPAHYLCTHCYADGKKSVLNRVVNPAANGFSMFVCRCKAQIQTPYRGQVGFRYAEALVATTE